MAKIPLRAYNREIELLVERGQIDEAIAHTKYILRFFPKHIDTYRLLGKAFIESQRYSEAADILQRILSVVPDDFVSQIGMSIIREDEGNLDAAIFHMEHAFEIQPSNAAIQDELRRLYGRRDGVEPPKLRLTRGALVRMYARGDLYRQAVAEARAALSENPERYDLEAILARMYFQLGQKVEATETSTRLITRLPYCLEANRILAETLPGSSRAQEADLYRSRVNALDPYMAYTSPNLPFSNMVPDNAVTLDRLELEGAIVEGPDWAKDLGVDLPKEEIETQPWPVDAELPGPTPPTVAASTTEPLETPEVVVQPDNPELPLEKQEPIPQWMSSAGWQPLNGEIPAEHEPEALEEAVPAEVPDWLRSLQPDISSSPAIPDSETIGDQDGEPVPDWLLNIKSRIAEDTTKDIAPGEEWSPETAEETPEIIPAESETQKPEDWFAPENGSNFAQEPVTTPSEEISPHLPISESEAIDEGVAWLESLAARQGADQETLSTPVEQSSTEPPEWVIQELGEAPVPETGEISGEEPQPAEKEYISHEEQLEPVAELPIPEVEAELVAELPIPEVEAEPVAELPVPEVEPVAELPVPEVEAEPVAELPVLEVEAEPVAELPIPEVEAEPVAELPVPEVEAEPVAELPVPEVEAEPVAELPVLEVEAEPVAEVPVLEVEAEPVAELPVLEVEAEPVAELPVLEVEAEPVAELPVPEIEAEPVAELPLREVEAEPVAELPLREVEAEPVAELPVPEIEVEPVAELPIPEVEVVSIKETKLTLPPEDDFEATFAWLESLAAQQGADAGTLVSTPTDRPAEPPSWVTESAQPITELADGSALLEGAPLEMETPDEKTFLPSIPEDETASVLEAPRAPSEPYISFIEQSQPEQLVETPKETLIEPEIAVGDTKPTRIKITQEQPKPSTPVELVAPQPEIFEAIQPSEPILEESKPEVLQEPESLPDWLLERESPPPSEGLAKTGSLAPLPEWLQGIDEKAEEPAAQPSEESLSVANWLAARDRTTVEAESEPVPAEIVPPFEAGLFEGKAPPIEETLPVIPLPEPLMPTNPLLIPAQVAIQSGEIDTALGIFSELSSQASMVDETIQQIRYALTRYPVNVDLWQALGDAYIQNNQIPEALDAYNKAEELCK